MDLESKSTNSIYLLAQKPCPLFCLAVPCLVTNQEAGGAVEIGLAGPVETFLQVNAKRTRLQTKSQGSMCHHGRGRLKQSLICEINRIRTKTKSVKEEFKQNF